MLAAKHSRRSTSKATIMIKARGTIDGKETVIWA